MHRSKLVLVLLAVVCCALAAGPAHGQSFTTLGSFNGTNGLNPTGDVTVSGSTLYGVTYNGGPNHAGNVFSLPLAGGTPTNLLSFNGSNGSSPNGSLTLSGTTLYGNTQGGGVNGSGEVFSIPAAGGSPTTVGSFGGGSSGTDAGSSLALSANGSTLFGLSITHICW